MTKTSSVVKNADNETSMPWGNESFVVGSVYEVNGPGAKELPDFVPTRHEVLMLAEYWERTMLEIEYEWFITGTVGSSDMRTVWFARNRIYRIFELVGSEDVQEVIDSTDAEFQKTKDDPRLWEIFTHGDQKAREAVIEEFWRVRSLETRDDQTDCLENPDATNDPSCAEADTEHREES